MTGCLSNGECIRRIEARGSSKPLSGLTIHTTGDAEAEGMKEREAERSEGPDEVEVDRSEVIPPASEESVRTFDQALRQAARPAPPDRSRGPAGGVSAPRSVHATTTPSSPLTPSIHCSSTSHQLLTSPLPYWKMPF